jgi:glycosyltransferase involved in cell wall biosynthesis
MPSLRVLHLLGACEDTGGILTTLRNLQTATAARGVEHVLWVNQAYREVRQPRLNYRYSRHLVQDCYNHFELAFRALRALPELRALRRAEPFDVLHAHTRGSFVLAVLLTRLSRRRLVYTNHGFATRRGMYRWGAASPRLVTCVLTPNMARYYGLDTAAPNIRVISECCADDLFERPTVPGGFDPARPVRLAGLGNIVSWKNWHLILEAVAQLADADRRRLEFHHWGPVPNDPECRAYQQQLEALRERHRLGASCWFHGLSLAVEERLRTADWFVLPSRNEPCSLALIEALALGLPALVSGSGGNVDIVRPEQTGLLFESENVASLTDGLRRIARGETQLLPPAAIRESVRSRSATIVAGQYLELYRTLLPSGGAH